MASSITTHVIQVTNVAPAATLDQMKELFGYLGKIKEIKLYPTDNFIIEPQARVCYVQYSETWSVGVAQHLTNTVFIDRALIVVPIADGIPSEATALALTNPTSALPGLVSSGPNPLINEISGVDGNLVITTIDPKLTALGLPQYPPLPANMDPAKIEEIRRTVYVGNLDSTVTADQLLKFVNQIGEVKYVRMAGDETQPTRFAFVEFSDQSSVAKALQYNGVVFESRPLKINHSNNAIVKPQPKSTETAQKEIDEAMKRVREAQSLITAAIEPELADKDKKRSRRSHSRSRSRRRSSSRSRRKKRSRSRSKSSRSRRRSRSSIRSRSRRSRSRTPSKRSKRDKSRSRSRDKRKTTVSPRRRKGKSRSRSRDRSKKHHRTRSRSHTKSPSKSKSRKSGSTKESSKSDRSRNHERSPKRDKAPKKETIEVKPETQPDEGLKVFDVTSTEEYGPPVLTPEVPLNAAPPLKDSSLEGKIEPPLNSEIDNNCLLELNPENGDLPDTNMAISLIEVLPDVNMEALMIPLEKNLTCSPDTPSKKERSKSPMAQKSTSPSDKHSRSPSERLSTSPTRRFKSTKVRSRSPSKGRSRSPSKRKSRSISKRRSRSRSRKRSRSASKLSRRKSTRSPSIRRRRSRTPPRRRNSRSGTRSGAAGRRVSRSPRCRSRSPRRKSPKRRSRSRRKSPTPKRRSRTPRRRSPSPKHHSRSPSYRRRSRSPKRSRSPGRVRSHRSPPLRRSRSPRKRSPSLSPNESRSRKKRDKREDSLERENRRKSRPDGEGSSKDLKVVRNYDEEEKGYDSNLDKEGKPKEHEERVEKISVKTEDSNASFYNSGDMDLDSD